MQKAFGYHQFFLMLQKQEYTEMVKSSFFVSNKLSLNSFAFWHLRSTFTIERTWECFCIDVFMPGQWSNVIDVKLTLKNTNRNHQSAMCFTGNGLNYRKHTDWHRTMLSMAVLVSITLGLQNRKSFRKKITCESFSLILNQ